MSLTLKMHSFFHLLTPPKSDAVRKPCYYLGVCTRGRSCSAVPPAELCALLVPQGLKCIVVKTSSKRLHHYLDWNEKLLYAQESTETELGNI